MWNLLGGFAGLISVGQQAFIGIGAYGLWLLRRRAPHPSVSWRSLRGGAGRSHRAAHRAAALPSAGRLLRHRHVGVRRDHAHHRLQHPGHGRRVGDDRSCRPPAIPFETRIHGTYWIGLTVAVGSVLHRLLPAALEGRPRADGHPRQRPGGAELGRQRLPLQAHRLCGRGLRLRRHGRGGRAATCSSSSRRRRSTSTGRRSPSSSSSSAASARSRDRIIGAVIFFALQQTLSQHGSTYMLLLGAIAVVMATKAPRGIWGWVVARWDLHLFPVRRGLVIESPKKKAQASRGPAAPIA